MKKQTINNKKQMVLIILLIGLVMPLMVAGVYGADVIGGCTDNPSISPYALNQVFFTSPFAGNISSSCGSENELTFVYCDGNILAWELINCRCVQGKCIPGYQEIPYWIAHIGEYERFAGGIITNDFVNFVVRGWINR